MAKILLVLVSIAVFFLYGSVQSSEVKIDSFRNSSICNTTGYACKNCHLTVLCILNGTEFQEIPVETCKGENTCLNGKCTPRPNPQCNGNNQTQFICQTGGMYPDLFDCQKYHYCVKDRFLNNLTRFTETCGCGYSYNMRTTFCDIPLNNDNTCNGTYPKATCYSVGQTDYMSENPSLYYICRRHPTDYNYLYPFLYACENGKRYNPQTYLCY